MKGGRWGGRKKNIIDEWRKHTFFSFQSARRPTPDTFTTLKRTPGISPFAFPRRPKPEIRTSSFSSTKFKQPSFYDNHQLIRAYSVYERYGTYRHESGDLFAVLNELHTHALADGRVGLLGLDTDFFENDALCMRRTSCWRGLVDVAEGTLFVGLVRLDEVWISQCLKTIASSED